MESMQKIERRKIVPIAAMVSAGKSKLLNVLYNINFLETRDGIATKFVNILRYNPNITKPRFYHLKLVKEGNDYIFYKDLNSEEVTGEEKIIEENININNLLSAQIMTNYEEIFYMTEINESPFIKDKNYLLTHDLCDIPGLSEYQNNKEKEENIKEINTKNGQSDLDQKMKKGEEEFGLFYNVDLLREEEEKDKNNNLINNNNKETDKDNNEDDIFYQVNIEKETTYLTKIFNIIKNYIDGAIIVLSLDKFYYSENYELIAKLHKVIQKDINNFLIILNKIDLSQNQINDIEKCKGLLIQNFPKGKTFNLNSNTFIPLSTFQLQNELLMSQDFKYLINYHFFNYVSKMIKGNCLNNTPIGLSFINHLKDIIKINGITNKEIENKIKLLNESENIEKMNDQLKLIINNLKQFFPSYEINMGITEENFTNTDEGNLLDDDDDANDEQVEGQTDDGNNNGSNNNKEINPADIIKILYIYHKEKQLIPTFSEETNRLLDYFTIKKIEKKEDIITKTTKDGEAKINWQIIDSLEILYEEFKNSKIDINEINELINELLKTIEYLKTYDSVYIPFLGPSNAGKTTLLNGIIGEDILPTGMNECTKRGIIINYCNSDEITIGKAYFKEKTVLGHLFYSFEKQNIIGKGIDQVKETLNGLNYQFSDKKEDFFYYITTRIKLFEELGLDEDYKNTINLIDFPGYGTKNIYEKEIYNKVMSICNSFIFVVRNSLIKENINKDIMNSIFTQAKEQKKKSSQQFANSCLFIFNNDNSSSTSEKDIERAKKDIKEILNGVDKDYIKVCFFNAKFYSNFSSIKNFFFNLKNSFLDEMKNYLLYQKQMFTDPESIKDKKCKTFCNFFSKILNGKIISGGFGSKISPDQKKDEKVDKQINEIFQELNIKGDKEKDKFIKIISFARGNISNIKFHKESNISELQNLLSLQIYLIFYDVQEAFKLKINEITSTLDLFFRKDIINRQSDLNYIGNFKNQINKIQDSLESEKKNGKNKIICMIENYKENVINSLKKKEKDFEIQLESKKYKAILNDINEEIKNNLNVLNDEITEFIDKIDIPALKIYSESIKIISEYSKVKIDFPKDIRFGDNFSKIFGNTQNNIKEEIFLEIKMLSNSLVSIYDKKGFLEWFSSILSDYKCLLNFNDIIVNTFIRKINYILRLMKEQYEIYINNLIGIINFRANSITVQFTKEQKEIWENLIELYQDIRSHIIDIKFKLLSKYK